MEWINHIENFFKKVETFFTKIDFVPRLFTAAGVGMKAFNDKLLKRNDDVLEKYLNDRK